MSSQRFSGLVIIAALIAASAPAAQQTLAPLDAGAIRAAIERRLAVTPRGFERLTSPAQAGVRLNDVRVEPLAGRQRITLDLSQRALTYDPSGDVELVLDQILNSTAAFTSGSVEFRFLVDGLPLDQFTTRAPEPPRVQTRQADAARPIVISAGHGLYFNETWNLWMLQRSYYWGITEDLVNWEIASLTLDELAWHGIDARPARQPDRWAGAGASGYPRWQESAKYFIRTLGAPVQISDYGANEYNRDINSRPFYANFVDAAALVSIHNNGGGGTGTETWYDETNGWAHESRRLAQIVNDRVVQAIRTHYDPNWVDRGLKSCNACKGETRLALRPAVILEIAFMDMGWPDNTALQDERFKRLVAQAIREAVQEWAYH